MYKILRPSKDAYVTNRVIKGSRVHNANVGSAGSLDLFKLYGYTYSGSTANIELSRLLIKFDLDPLRALVSNGSVDMNHSSFACSLCLSDVYGGQPTPSNFSVSLYPLSRSFDEGLGRDVVYYADRDVCNFYTGSRAQGAWLLSGCALGGGATQTVDYITASAAGSSYVCSQNFVTGIEDLAIDVTTIVSSTIANSLPDEGFRISLSDACEQDQKTYFVKRFASRTAYNEAKRPKLIVKYDDSIQDDSQSLTFDSPNTIFVRNYINRSLTNFISASTSITGSNSLKLRLTTEISGGMYTLEFSGSQYSNGLNPVQGIYSATFTLPSTNTVFATKLAQSGSVKLTPIWSTLDGTMAYVTGTALTVSAPQRTSILVDDHNLSISAHGLQKQHSTTETVIVRVNLFDSSLVLTSTRLPIERSGLVLRDVHYQVRDNTTEEVIIPFDTIKNSTRLSSDSKGMYFILDVSNLTAGRSYVIDALVKTGSNTKVYKSVSSAFQVV